MRFRTRVNRMLSNKELVSGIKTVIPFLLMTMSPGSLKRYLKG